MTPRAGAVEAGRRDEGRVWLALPGHASTVPSTASDCEQSGRGAPSGNARVRLAVVAGTAWSAKCYMNMRPLYQPQVVQTEAVA